MASTTVGIKLDPEIKARLLRLAKARDRSPHWLMKTAIDQYIEKEENFENEWREDQERLREYRLMGNGVAQAKMEAWAASLPDE